MSFCVLHRQMRTWCDHPAGSEQREQASGNGPAGPVGQGLSALVRNSPLALLCGLLFLGLGCGGPPTLQSEEAVSTADALYTAITSHRIELLDDCAADLKELSDSGKLSMEAYESLGSISRQARSGDWQNAAEALDIFIRHQPPRAHSH